MKKALFFLLLILILIPSCKKGGDVVTAEKEEKEKGIYPDVILENAEYHIGQEGSSPIVMKAKKITFYSKDGYALTEDMEFVSFSRDGKEEIRGSAGQGRIDTEGSSMDLWNGVVFEDKERNMKILGDTLFYDRSEDTLVADGRVVVESEEGNFTGNDFRGDLRSGVFTFLSIEEGVLNFE